MIYGKYLRGKSEEKEYWFSGTRHIPRLSLVQKSIKGKAYLAKILFMVYLNGSKVILLFEKLSQQYNAGL